MRTLALQGVGDVRGHHARRLELGHPGSASACETRKKTKGKGKRESQKDVLEGRERSIWRNTKRNQTAPLSLSLSPSRHKTKPQVTVTAHFSPFLSRTTGMASNGGRRLTMAGAGGASGAGAGAGDEKKMFGRLSLGGRRQTLGGAGRPSIGYTHVCLVSSFCQIDSH